VRPVTAHALAEEVADLAHRLVPGAAGAGVAVRLGIDSAVVADGGALADAVAGTLSSRGLAAVRVRAGDFLHRRSVRLEYGPGDVDAAFDRTVDWSALVREVLDPLADPDGPRWLPRLWDAGTDRPARERARGTAPGTVAVVDGPYLLRWEMSGAFDVVVHLDLSPAALARRFPDADDPRPGAWRRYLAETDPASRADLVVRFDHPDRPAIRNSRPGSAP
jgi:hypothetical protein